MMLTVGHITYANCAPFFQYLPELGFEGRIVPGVPTELNELLATGGVDVSPSSSFEYARNWRRYLLLPDLSISSRGPVHSVLLFAPGHLADLEGTEIALTGESATSVNLLHVLMREFCGWREVRLVPVARPVEEVIAAGGAALLIGDRALRAARQVRDARIFDLGELWYRYTGLPFVFALWILRREAAEAKRAEVERLIGCLNASRTRSLNSLPELAARVPESRWMGQASLVEYWRRMSFDLTDDHLEGLRLYFRLLVRYGLLDEVPEIHFFESR